MKLFGTRTRQVAVAALLAVTIISWHVEAMAGQLALTWTDNSTNETGFAIERSIGTTGSFAEIATTGTVAAYTDVNVASATTYCYRVRAYNAAAAYSTYSNVSCGATALTFGLAVLKVGAGSGTVISAPVGINCGASCSGSYASGTAVSLTATPAAGSTFTGWSGAGCGGTGTCTVTLAASTTVTATFAVPSALTLTVSKAGTGSGTVTSAPAGINCGATCAGSYASGTA